MKLELLNCGRHYSKGGPCAKCSGGVLARDISAARNQRLLAAVEPVTQSIQDRAIESAHRAKRPHFSF